MQRLWLMGFAALVVAAGGTANAQISDDVVKIGVLTDMSFRRRPRTGPAL